MLANPITKSTTNNKRILYYSFHNIFLYITDIVMASHISSKIIFTIASTQVQQLWTMVIQRKLGNIGLTYPGTYKPHSLGTMVAYTFSKTPNIGILFLDRTHQANRTQSHWRIGGVKTNKHTRNVTRSGKSKYHPLYLLWELMFHNHNEQICLHSAARWIVSAGTEHLSPQRSLVQFLRQFYVRLPTEKLTGGLGLT